MKTNLNKSAEWNVYREALIKYAETKQLPEWCNDKFLLFALAQFVNDSFLNCEL